MQDSVKRAKTMETGESGGILAERQAVCYEADVWRKR